MRKSRGKRVRLSGSAASKQRGIVVPIVVIGLLAILAVAGLALDGSHALGNKTRMQNTVDAAALAAAKVLDDTDGDTALATAAANNLFSINASSSGNHEMDDAYGAGDISVGLLPPVSIRRRPCRRCSASMKFQHRQQRSQVQADLWAPVKARESAILRLSRFVKMPCP